MVLRRIVNSTTVGCVLGASLSNHLAEEHLHIKSMMTERDAMGLPYFRERLATDWPMTQQDIDRWDAMGRNHRHGQAAVGGALGAVAGAAVGLATRREPTPPRPQRVACFDPNGPQTLHLPGRVQARSVGIRV